MCFTESQYPKKKKAKKTALKAEVVSEGTLLLTETNRFQLIIVSSALAIKHKTKNSLENMRSDTVDVEL